MGLLSWMTRWNLAPTTRPHSPARRLGIEQVERRRLLAVSPLAVGAVYVEEDLGSDANGDRFEISFNGGAPGTQLARVVINGDQNAPGFGVGDVFFDTEDSGFGADHSFPLKIELLDAADPSATVSVRVVDGTSQLVIEFTGFRAGDRLVFSIDVDEVEQFDPRESDLGIINDGFDPVTSGVEFQGSTLRATFTAPHYHDAEGTAEFRNRYDDLLIPTGLRLPRDDDGGKRDRSAGAVLKLVQSIKPASISGHVYHDRNNNGIRETNEPGIPGVMIQLVPVITVEPQSPLTVFTGPTGSYAFANVMPGSYRIVEAQQPAGYLDGLDSAGRVGGVPVGTAQNPGDAISGIVLDGGQIGTDYNFGEILPGSISGSVHLSTRHGDCTGDESINRPLQRVLVELLDAGGNFLESTLTDADGKYAFHGLAPGVYQVRETTPDGLINGGAHVGRIGEHTVGQATGDVIRGVALSSGDQARDYSFCEHEPASLSGHVYHDANNNGRFDRGESGIAGVHVRLLDGAGVIVATIQTDSGGAYEFAGLRAGTYTIVELQPAGWLDGIDTLGRVAGAPAGVLGNDRLSDIVVWWGDQGVDFDFGELLPGSISGRVHADLDGDCIFDPGEQPLSGVEIQLLNSAGAVIGVTYTDANGRYRFENLEPGQYAIREVQVIGLFHGGQRVGSGGGQSAADDLLTGILVGSGQDLTDYDFCEVPPASLSGLVHADPNRNCRWDFAEAGLAGVRIELVGPSGQVVATTTTDSAGRYRFDALRAGIYAVRETQPAGYFHGGQRAGSAGGDDSQADVVSGIVVGAGAHLVDYDFCEQPPSRLSGYVFQDGPTLVTADGTPPAILIGMRDGRRTPDDQPIAGVVLQLRNGLTGEVIDAAQALPGQYVPGPIEVVTDARGFYEFRGLRAGNYAVYQVHPDGFADGIDTPGTTSGIAINRHEITPQALLAQLVHSPNDDAIIRIPLGAGVSSEENNFSEIRVGRQIVLPPLERPLFPPPRVVVPPPRADVPWRAAPPVGWAPAAVARRDTSGGGLPMTWHLSVIDAGTPRHGGDVAEPSGVWRTASHLEPSTWVAHTLDYGQWMLKDAGAQHDDAVPLFGLPGSVPVTGDFDGDGIDDVGVYLRGQWFLDLNGNGRWDEQDLWAYLGGEHDLPVTGDWDGDGKDDIGIFGPAWPGDPLAIQAEPGLPDPLNQRSGKPKNVPPAASEATSGQRLLKQSAFGSPRSDVIDHVFYYGDGRHVPVAGDWNGDGITSIGVFHEGRWRLDTDGDGRPTDRDRTATFGQPGDVPVVGDFDGDGVDEIGVYRRGTWYLDTNRNYELDAHDRVFSMGSADDRPIVGDFNGDGIDEPGLYREAAGPAESSQARK